MARTRQKPVKSQTSRSNSSSILRDSRNSTEARTDLHRVIRGNVSFPETWPIVNDTRETAQLLLSSRTQQVRMRNAPNPLAVRLQTMRRILNFDFITFYHHLCSADTSAKTVSRVFFWWVGQNMQDENRNRFESSQKPPRR